MKFKPFFYTFLVASAVTFGYVQTRRRLTLIYENNSGRLIINIRQRLKCCDVTTIKKIVIMINGEEFRSLYYKPGEKTLDGPVIIDLPEAEVGDFIKVRLTSSCSKQFTTSGSLDVI